MYIYSDCIFIIPIIYTIQVYIVHVAYAHVHKYTYICVCIYYNQKWNVFLLKTVGSNGLGTSIGRRVYGGGVPIEQDRTRRKKMINHREGTSRSFLRQSFIRQHIPRLSYGHHLLLYYILRILIYILYMYRVFTFYFFFVLSVEYPMWSILSLFSYY